MPPSDPLKPHWFHILVALATEERHGLDIARDCLEQTSGALRLWPATLYGTLEQLAANGLIEPLTGPGAHPTGESERRRYYRITRAGRTAMREELKRLEALTRTVRARLSPRSVN